MNYAAIAAAMRAEIETPQKLYMPNSPGAFVRDRLFKECHWEEATWFWFHYCSASFGIQEFDDLYSQLKELDKHEKMPDWGTRGT